MQSGKGITGCLLKAVLCIQQILGDVEYLVGLDLIICRIWKGFLIIPGVIF